MIIVKNAGLLKKETKRKSTKTEGMQDKLANYIKENNNETKQSNIILLIETEVEKNELYYCIEQLGIICNFEKLKPIAITKRLKPIVNAYQVKIADSTLEYFVRSLWNFYARPY